MSKIEIKNVYKIFGNTPSEVLPIVKRGATKEEVIKDYPEITEEALHACLVYAATKERQLEVA